MREILNNKLRQIFLSNDKLINNKRLRLLRIHSSKPELVCSESSELVIEGSARSANTFFVTYVRFQQREAGTVFFDIAHHTHRIENVTLGLMLKKPIVILIRKPEDAVTSHFLFAKKQVPIKELSKRWMDFYRFVKANQHKMLVVSFEAVVSSPNYVIQCINERFSLELACSVEEEVAIKQVNQINEERSSRVRNKEDHRYKAATPTDERRVLKEQVYDDVKKECERLSLDRLYSSIQKI